MLATSTHDSKRGEDLRARINVLAEDPAAWEDSLQRLNGWGELYLTQTEAGPAPGREDIWLLFQTLAGLWPAVPTDEAQRSELRHRIQAYMLKAAREAKLYTSWVCPVPAYEDALARYIDAVLRAGEPNPFVEELDRVAARFAPFGFRNSLVQLAIKLTAPGVPDIYQGSEQWNFSLVDPDNRRPADFAALAVQLERISALYARGWPVAADWRKLSSDIANGHVKQLVTWRLLQLRRRWPQLFRDGAYLPLALAGVAADHAVAYARHHQEQVVIVIAARLTYTLCGSDPGRWGPGAWGDTVLVLDGDNGVLDGAGGWRDWLTGREFDDGAPKRARGLSLSQLFAGPDALPFAVLVPADRGPAT